MAADEGFIKFDLDWNEAAPPASPDLSELVQARDRLHRRGLIAAGADVEARDYRGRTALVHAVRFAPPARPPMARIAPASAAATRLILATVTTSGSTALTARYIS